MATGGNDLADSREKASENSGRRSLRFLQMMAAFVRATKPALIVTAMKAIMTACFIYSARRISRRARGGKYPSGSLPVSVSSLPYARPVHHTLLRPVSEARSSRSAAPDASCGGSPRPLLSAFRRRTGERSRNRARTVYPDNGVPERLERRPDLGASFPCEAGGGRRLDCASSEGVDAAQTAGHENVVVDELPPADDRSAQASRSAILQRDFCGRRIRVRSSQPRASIQPPGPAGKSPSTSTCIFFRLAVLQRFCRVRRRLCAFARMTMPDVSRSAVNERSPRSPVSSEVSGPTRSCRAREHEEEQGVAQVDARRMAGEGWRFVHENKVVVFQQDRPVRVDRGFVVVRGVNAMRSPSASIDPFVRGGTVQRYAPARICSFHCSRLW
jgi:hypothetical protein